MVPGVTVHTLGSSGEFLDVKCKTGSYEGVVETCVTGRSDLVIRRNIDVLNEEEETRL